MRARSASLSRAPRISARPRARPRPRANASARTGFAARRRSSRRSAPRERASAWRNGSPMRKAPSCHSARAALRLWPARISSLNAALEPVRSMPKKQKLPPVAKIDTEAGPWIVPFVRGHVRLWIAIAVGILVYALVPANVGNGTRFLLGWDVGVSFYLSLAAVTMAGSPPSEIRYHSPMQDGGAFALLLLAAAGAVVSTGGQFAEIVGM